MGDISQRGLDLIKQFEGYYSNAYRCPAGVWTIGYGTIRWDLKRPVREGETITREEAERQLLREVQRVEDAVDEAVTVPLTQSQFDALVSWGYNVGIGWITGKGHQQATLIKELNKGRYNAVPGMLMQFCKTIGGKRLKGLENRRKAECKMWLSEDDEAIAAHSADAYGHAEEQGGMPQAVIPATKTTTAAIKDAATQSPSFIATIIGGITYAANWMAHAFGFAASTVSEAAAPVSDATQKLGPFEALLKAAGGNIETITAVVIVGVLATVAVRKVMEKRETA